MKNYILSLDGKEYEMSVSHTQQTVRIDTTLLSDLSVQMTTNRSYVVNTKRLCRILITKRFCRKR